MRQIWLPSLRSVTLTVVESANRESMNNTIYVKTAEGEREAFTNAHELPLQCLDMLETIDGRHSVEALRSKLDYLPATAFDEALATLAAGGYIRDSGSATPAVVPSPSLQSSVALGRVEVPEASVLMPADSGTDQSTLSSVESMRKAQALRAKIRARREGTEHSAPAGGRRDRPSEAHAGSDDEQHSGHEAAERERRETEELARQEAEEEARRQVVERVRQETEEQERRDADEEARRQAVERARQEAEEQARQAVVEQEARRQTAERARLEAEERERRAVVEEEARRQAVERARQEAEEKTRRVAEEEARRQAAEQAQREAEERARRDAEELARQEAEEQERLDFAREAKRVREEEAEAHARWMAEEKAWREAEEKLRREEEAAARDRVNVRAVTQARMTTSEMLRKWGKALVLGFVALVVGGLAAIHLISFDGQIPQFEKSLAAQFQQPVRIKALRLALVPQRYVGLEGVSIGSEGQIRVSRIKLAGGIGNLFGDKKAFASVEFDSPVVTEEGLGWILFGKPLARNMVFGQVSALNVTLESKNISFPAFDARLQSDGEGAWKTISIESQDKNLSLDLTPKGEAVQIGFKARSFRIPFGSALTLDEMVANGIADRGGLTLSEFKGFAYGGILSGNANLKWGASWTLEGELNAKQVDTGRLVPELLEGGRLAGKASYILQAPEATKLFAAPRLEGTFNIPRGTLLGADLGSMLQGGGARGETKFTDLTGSLSHDRGATQFRQVSLSQGTMSATGMFDVDADQNVRGRFAADLKLAAELRRANLTLSGTVKKLEWRR